jgi:OmcA/MtrC family decaheme c-type cytochrome
MRTFNIFFKLSWTFLVAVFLTFGLTGCEGDDGAPGADGTDGTNGTPGAAGPPGTDGTDGQACWDLNGNGIGDVAEEDLNLDGVVDVKDCGPGSDAVAAAIDMAAPESCGVCHDGVGGAHQAIYDSYVDETALAMTFDSVASVADGAGGFDVTLEFTVLKDGAGLQDLSTLGVGRFYAVQYFAGDPPQYLNSCSLGRTDRPGVVTIDAVNGQYSLTANCTYAPEASDALVYGYIGQTPLVFAQDGTGTERIYGSTYVTLYDDLVNTAVAYGAAQDGALGAYESVANVEGCENCHGAPYLKHGQRAAAVEGLPDFAACKVCHYDDRTGGHEDWQQMIDDPVGWAAGAEPSAALAYTANVMNDTHMSHAMEFPYPQSMSTCATCHEGKLDTILDDSYFTAATCKSCHVPNGINANPGDDYYQGNRPPSLAYLWSPEGGLNDDDLDGFHAAPIASDSPTACTVCHGDVDQGYGGFPGISYYHSGYDASIYDADGVRYAETYTVQIDAVTQSGDNGELLKIDFSSNNPSVEPEVLVSFYGWDSKNFIIASHARDGSDRCPSRRGDGCRFEYEPGDTNPLFQDFAVIEPGVWTVTANLAEFVPAETDDILTLIADGVVKLAEVTITPVLEVDGDRVVLSAVDETIDVRSGLVVADYFKGANSTVEVEKCNACHDALASSFHDGSGRAGDGIEVCKNCHNPTFDGGHIEMTSRSIDSYVHAIHTFQDFDVDDTFEIFDPVLAKRYDQHIKHVFPNFTITNCEACHRAGKYDVPDQAQSIPGFQSASSEVLTWYEIVDGLAVEDADGRNIGMVPPAVTGPASRACGGCHRARLVRDDAAGDLAAFNAHTESFGTYVENPDEDEAILFGIIDKIMSMFE